MFTDTAEPNIYVIGAGMVGASTANCLVTNKLGKSVYLMDIDQALLDGQIEDLSQASTGIEGPEVSEGKYEDITADDIVIITCGRPQVPGQSRLDLYEGNRDIMASVVGDIVGKAKGTPIIIMVTNPVDALTAFIIEKFSLDRSRVFGSGTYLDSIRLRLALKLNQRSEDPKEVWVLGEHGDNSINTHQGKLLEAAELTEYVKDSAHRIIAGKGSTYFGIATALSNIVMAIINDANVFIPLSVYLQGEYNIDKCSLSVPVKIGRNGVEITEEYLLEDAVKSKLKQVESVLIEAMQN